MGFEFEKLEVYQEALRFVDEIYSLTQKFPSEEQFGLTGQLRKAGVSIALNIAEGSGRLKKEFKYFLRISRTSVYECVAIFQILLRQGYINMKEYEHFYAYGERLARRISALINSMTK